MADTPPPRFQVGRFLLITGFVLLSLAVIGLFAPIWECPICWMDFRVDQGADDSGSKLYILGKGCDHCWRGRLSGYHRWLDPHSPFPGSHYTEAP